MNGRALGVALVALALGCQQPPSGALAPAPPRDAGRAPDAGQPPLLDRSFGVEGERPRFGLVFAPAGARARLIAATDRAIYALDDDARVLARHALPRGTGGAPAALVSLHVDDVGLVALVSASGAGGPSLLFASAEGRLESSASTTLVAGSRALAAGRGARTWVVELREAGTGVELRQRVLTRRGTQTTSAWHRLPWGGIGLADLHVVDRERALLCTVGGHVDAEPSAQLWLLSTTAAPRRFIAPNVPSARAMGACRVVSDGAQTALMISDQLTLAAPAAGSVDAAPDAVRYPRPQVDRIDLVSGSIRRVGRLTLWGGAIAVRELLWDGRRFVALFDLRSYLGGRLLLSTFDGAGARGVRDRWLALPYEPGSITGARLALTSTDLVLVYGLRRAWDTGILRLARFATP